MILNKIKKGMVGLAVLMSMNAQAQAEPKVEQFQEFFSGTLVHTEIFDPTYFKGQSAFLNGDVSLTLFHEVVDLLPDFYIALGTFTRNDGSRTFSGIFDFSVISTDPFNPPDPSFVFNQITGFIQYDQSIYSPVTGDLLIADRGFGEIKGFIGQQDDVSFTIDWLIQTGAVVSSVPEPQTAWMLCIGLLVLVRIRDKCTSPKTFPPHLEVTSLLERRNRHD